jgi:hypothetical protein
MAELKACKCGRADINVLHISLGPGYACLVGCMSTDCDLAVIRYGLTKNHAEWRAIRAWNQEVERSIKECL